MTTASTKPPSIDRLAAHLHDSRAIEASVLDAAIERRVLLGGQLDTALLEVGALNEAQLGTALSRAYSVRALSRDDLVAIAPGLSQAFPKRLAERHQAIPVELVGRRLTVCVAGAPDLALLDEIGFMLSVYVKAVVTSEVRLIWARARLYDTEILPRFQSLLKLLNEPSERPFVEERWVMQAGVPGEAPSDASTPSDDANNDEAFEAVDVEPSGWGVLENNAAPVGIEAQDIEVAASEQPPLPVGASSMAAQLTVQAVHERLGDDDDLDARRRAERVRWTVDDAIAELACASDRDGMFDVVLRFAHRRLSTVAVFGVLRTAHVTQLIGWDGIDPVLSRRQIASFVVPMTDDTGLLLRAAAMKSHVLGPYDATDPLEQLFARRPRAALVVPVLLRDRVVALIYGDGGERPVPPSALAELHMVVPRLEKALVNLVLRKKAEAAKPEATSDDTEAIAQPPASDVDVAAAFRSDVAAEAVVSPTLETSAPVPPAPAEETQPWALAVVHADGEPARTEQPSATTTTVVAPLEPAPAEEAPVPVEPAPPLALHEATQDQLAPAPTDAKPVSDDDEEEPIHLDAVVIAALKPRPKASATNAGEPDVVAAAFTSTAPKPVAADTVVVTPHAAPTADHSEEEAVVLDEASVMQLRDAVRRTPKTVSTVIPETPAETPAPVDAADPPMPLLTGDDLLPVTIAASPGRHARDTLLLATYQAWLQHSDDGVDAMLSDVPMHGARTPAERMALARVMSLGERAMPALARYFPGTLTMHPFMPHVTRPAVADLSDCLFCLTHLGADLAAPILTGALSHPDRLHRFAATYALSAIDVPGAVVRLAMRVFDPENTIATLAIDVLGRYAEAPGFERVLEGLRDLLRRGDPFHQQRALWALCDLRDRSALILMVELLDHPTLAAGARESLRDVTKQDFGTAKRQWRSWLADNDDAKRTAWLIEGLLAKDADLRKSSAEELNALTGRNLGYRHDAPAHERETSVRAWLSWWQAQLRDGRPWP